MAQSIATLIEVAQVSNKNSAEVKFASCGLIFTNQTTGQNEHWSQGGKGRYSFKLGKMFFIRDDQAWIADNSSMNKEAFKTTYDKLLKIADNAASVLELPRKALLQMHDKAYTKALSLSLRVSI
jgi:hypothetical protein